ncbi:TetR/AcrR family transcriptional regulator [Mucilaginibacter celer]|uniref:TetR family transcriptional regulator n=1 Tax=Mucilaginibacter celer TaxID=2305508 RepID=A0A494VLN3_9SPHI|nr:TetR/AcrR family transcriptional regulator [Mucilaginibacter celer]AYL96177.1 TetR family transcriptional regulator [Mucilaginibacter celer]
MTKQRGQIVTDKILDTAERLFYGQGYNATGINQVIEEADIAKASLYKHFESKADLMLGYMQRYHQQWLSRIETCINQIADPKEKILAIFDHHAERQKYRDFGGCPFIKANNEAGSTDPRIQAEIQQAKQQFKDILKQLVNQTNHKHILSDAELAELIYLLIEGGVAAGSVFKQATDLQNAKQIIQQFI